VRLSLSAREFSYHHTTDFADPEERVHELANLISALPLANYTLLRALTAHLILIVQNAAVNKMTVRNVGIVFNPTLGIPAGVFSLMLGEFNRVFNVDTESISPIDPADAKRPQDILRRNSQQYTDAAADQMLGLSGRSLPCKCYHLLPHAVSSDQLY
jgi:RalA-binding protein 1